MKLQYHNNIIAINIPVKTAWENTEIDKFWYTWLWYTNIIIDYGKSTRSMLP